jgi:hypothetical protein
MKMALRIHQSNYLCFAMLLLACRHDAPPHLPSRPISELFPRGSSPPPSCPGQYRTVIEDASGDIFMGCWGRNTD